MISAEELRKRFLYDPETGIFSDRETGRSMGDLHANGGWRNGKQRYAGYVRICIDYKRYRAHRLAWLYMTGEWPTDQIDHKNRIRHDNRWENLRLADNSENGINKALQSNNTSGYPGVHFKSSKRKWEAFVKINGKKKGLGIFSRKEDAITARKSAESKFYGEWVPQ